MDTTTFTKICREKLAAALIQYGVTDIVTADKIQITCDIKGRCVGRAGYSSRGGFRSYYLKFNAEAIAKYTDEMVDTTIAHEIAHIICYIRPALGRNHDAGWKKVCRSLGGDDARTHTMKLSPGKTITRHKYNVNGKVIEVSAKRHKQILRGAKIVMRACGTRITHEMHMTSVVIKPDTIVQAAPKPAAAPQQTGGTKADQARALYLANQNLSVAQIKQLFIDVVGLTKAGANTYYYNITKKG